MKTYTKIISVLALLALAAPAFAADPTPRPTPIRKASGFDGSQPIVPDGAGDATCTFAYTVNGGAMSLNDTLGLCKLPKGAVIEEWYLYMPAQGTAAVHSLGLQESVAAFLTTSTVGAAAAVASPVNNPNGLTANALPTSPLTADTYLMLKTTTAATTPNTTPGTINGWVRYHVHGTGF